MLLIQNFFKIHSHTHYISSSLIISFIENPYSIMNPSQSKGTKLISTAERSLKKKKEEVNHHKLHHQRDKEQHLQVFHHHPSIHVLLHLVFLHKFQDFGIIFRNKGMICFKEPSTLVVGRFCGMFLLMQISILK